MEQEQLDELLSAEAVKRGWAENKADFAARILRYVLAEVQEKYMQDSFTNVIRYLEAYEFDD